MSYFKQIGGSIFLVLSLASAHLAGTFWDLYGISIATLFLIVKWRHRGFFFALPGFVAVCCAVHFFASPDHFWRCGTELSLLASLILFFLLNEERCAEETRLFAETAEARKRVGNLEEEISLLQQENTQERMTSSDRLENSRRALTDLEEEKNALEILNDVLRKNQAASYTKEQMLEQELQKKGGALEEMHLLIDQNEQEIALFLQSIAKESAFLAEQECDQEEEIRSLEEVVAHLLQELSTPHFSTTLREAFSGTKGAQKLPALEETLRESLTAKRKKKQNTQNN
ncbi:MAG: hypothetical protein KGI80_01440 [Verrucomicrobiota bacterium]|nr:hypothetical protein [Verrucomicrobiota bacterium]